MLAICGQFADAMATTTKPLDLNDPDVIHTTQEDYDGLMKNYGFGSFRGTDRYEWPTEPPKKEIMPFQNDRIGFFSTKHFKDPEKAQMIYNGVMSMFGAPNPKSTINATKAMLETMTVLRKYLMKTPSLARNYIRGYKILNKSSPLTRSWEDINMQEMGRTAKKSFLDDLIGEYSFDDFETFSQYDSMEELMTESEQLIKDKPLSKFLKDEYNFKLKQYEKNLQYKEIPLPAYQFKKEEENKFFLTNEMVDNSFAKRDVEEAVNDIKPPLEEPKKIDDTKYFEKRRPPIIKWQPIDDEINEHKRAKLDPIWQIDVNQQEKKVHSSKRSKRLGNKRKQK